MYERYARRFERGQGLQCINSCTLFDRKVGGTLESGAHSSTTIFFADTPRFCISMAS